MKLIKDIPGVPDLVARINEELPPEIRLWSIVSLNSCWVARALIPHSFAFLTISKQGRRKMSSSPDGCSLTLLTQVVR